VEAQELNDNDLSKDIVTIGITMRTCRICNRTLPLTINYFYFRHKPHTYRNECNRCTKDKSNKYAEVNRPHVNKRVSDWRHKNPEKVKDIERKRYNSHKITSYRWKLNNPEKVKLINKKANDKRYSSVKARIHSSISGYICKLLKGKKGGRKWEDLIGYSIQDLMSHLESKFKDGMSWNNYGKHGWSIDHIIPVSVFNFNSVNDMDFHRCWALSNLQPMWHPDNIRKFNRIDKPFQPSFALGIKEKHAIYTA
jgi:hypothetical protein